MFNIVWILSLKTKMSHWFIQLSFLDLQCFVVQWQICWPVLLVDRSILRHLLLRSLKKNYARPTFPCLVTKCLIGSEFLMTSWQLDTIEHNGEHWYHRHILQYTRNLKPFLGVKNMSTIMSKTLVFNRFLTIFRQVFDRFLTLSVKNTFSTVKNPTLQWYI